MTLIPPIYKPAPFEGKLIQKDKLTHDVYEFIFEVISPEDFQFEPGQFINIDIPGDEKKIVRSYSIASCPCEKELTLWIKIVDGPGSKYFNNLEIGKTVSGSGPFGIFAVKDDWQENMLFIATGTGVAPMHSMIKYQLSRNFSNKMTLMFGLRHEEDIFYDEFFTALSAEHDNFEYSLTLSQPKDTWQGREGRVTSLIRDKEFDLDNLRIFICGSQTMIEEVSSIFKEMGLSEERIHHEKFY